MTSSRNRTRTITTMGILCRLLIRTSAKLGQLSQTPNQSQGRSWLSIPKSSGAVNWLSTLGQPNLSVSPTHLSCRRAPKSRGSADDDQAHLRENRWQNQAFEGNCFNHLSRLLRRDPRLFGALQRVAAQHARVLTSRHKIEEVDLRPGRACELGVGTKPEFVSL